jgi:hypothetical protein
MLIAVRTSDLGKSPRREFSMIKPDPAETGDLVKKFAGEKPIPVCNLFGS